MTTLITNNLKEHIGNQLMESITEKANNVYYLVAAKHTSYANGDSSVPTPKDSYQEVQFDIYDEAIFGKKIASTDLNLMIPRYNWTTSTVYTPYDHEDSDLFTKQYYVVVDGGSNYYIYKCLDNNGNTASTEQPSSTSESACNFITTADGYTWKLMYTMGEATFEKFATSSYIPVVTSANVSGNSIFGAIDVIRISNNGSNYISTLTGQFNADDLRVAIPSITGNSTTYRLPNNASSSTDFYKNSALYISSGTGAGQLKNITDYDGANRVIVIESEFSTAPSTDSTYIIAPNVVITGDGSNASAYATVSSNATVNNFISKINVIDRGLNYTFSEATVTGNTGGVSNSAILKVIIPPYGGHGYDAKSELGASRLGISMSFNTNESGFITTDNDYRKLAIIKDPLFNDVTLTLDTEIGTFLTNENIKQINYKPLTGTVSGNTSCTTITGTATRFRVSLNSGDYVLITDSATGTSTLRIVDTVTNSSVISLASAIPFDTSFASISYVDIIANGVKTGNTSPYLTMSNVEPKFVTNKLIVGETSGATANVTAITVNEKNYNNWNTFDNRVRLSYSGSSGTMNEDTLVYSETTSTSNARFHSSNNTFVFLTEQKGSLATSTGSTLFDANSAATFTLSGTKYNSDLAKDSGKTLYVEYNEPISRLISQSETVRLVLNF